MPFGRKARQGQRILKVFVSYCRVDLQTVEVLVDDLKSLGHDVWYDQHLTGGQSWWDNILANIRSCDVFIPVLSADWLKSAASMLEYRYARALLKNMLPVALNRRDILAALPPEIAQLQILSYSVSNRDDLKKLLQAINRLPPPVPLPKVLPAPPPVPLSRLASIASRLRAPVLSPAEQASILFDLEQLLADPDETGGAIELLQQLRGHPGVLWAVVEKIDAIVRSFPPTGEVARRADSAHDAHLSRHAGRQLSEDDLGTWGELEEIYRTRSEFSREFSYFRMFDKARSIVAAGISLNAFALQYPRERIQEILLSGGKCQMCFLKPESRYCQDREQEEQLPPGTLAGLTASNINTVKHIRAFVSASDHESARRLELLVYDLPPRYNIYIVNDEIMTVQSYGYIRGEDTPTFVLRRQTDGGLFDFFASVVKYILAHAQHVPDALFSAEVGGEDHEPTP